MKTEFRLVAHEVFIGDPSVIEVWYDGAFLATIYPERTFAGIKIISRHDLSKLVSGTTSDGITMIHIPIEKK